MDGSWMEVHARSPYLLGMGNGNGYVHGLPRLHAAWKAYLLSLAGAVGCDGSVGWDARSLLTDTCTLSFVWSYLDSACLFV